MNVEEDRKVLAQFKDENGVLVKAPFDIPINITPDLLQSLCNALIDEVIKLHVQAGISLRWVQAACIILLHDANTLFTRTLFQATV